jgi:ribosomal protein RSM22 (predicted rRNA methylase)
MLPAFPQLLDELGRSFRHEGELLHCLKELHQAFTQEPQKINELYQSEKHVLAYAILYMNTNRPKLERLLSWLPTSFLKGLEESPLFDFGAGPGTLSWEMLAHSRHSEVYFLEAQAQMRKVYLHLAQKYFPRHQISSLNGVASWPLGGVYLFGHVAVEVGAQKILQWVDRGEPQAIFFLEPGTKKGFQIMMELRRELFERGMEIIYPCPSSGDCPWEKSEKDWCHQMMYFVHDQQLERLCQKLKLDRRMNPVVAHVYGRRLSNQNVIRSLRKLPETKHSYRFLSCSGAPPQIENFEVAKKSISNSEKKQLKKADTGIDLAAWPKK